MNIKNYTSKNSKEFYVYIYRDLDGTPIYVGKGKGLRWKLHIQGRGHNKRLTYTLNKRLEEDNVTLIPEIIISINEDHSFLLEKVLIEMFGRQDLKTGSLFNYSDGGEGPSGRITSEETKNKIRNSNLGRVISEETRAKMSKSRPIGWKRSEEHTTKLLKANIGRVHSEEQRRKASERATGKPCLPETREKLRLINTGKKASEETRAKMSEATKKQVFTKERSLKISAARKGYKATPETCEKLRLANSKPHERVKCPHCDKVGGKSAMTKHHFDNCKLKPKSE